MKRTLFLLIIFWAVSINAQTLTIPFLQGQSAFSGARSMGMGGAGVAYPDANSALALNPAGLGLIKNTGFYGSFLSMDYSNQAEYLGKRRLAEDTFDKMSNMGAVISVPTVQGSLVFGIAYQRVRNFESLLDVFDENTYGYIDIYDDVYNETIEFEVTPGYTGYDNGHLSKTIVGGSVEIAPGLFGGASANFWGGKRDYTWQYTELAGIYDISHSNGDQEEWMLPDLYITDHYLEQYTGANISIGILYALNSIIGIGCTIETPVTLTAKRDWESVYREEEYADFYENNQPESLVYEESETGAIRYKIKRPWLIKAGAAVTLGPFSVAGDMEMIDYSQFEYKTRPPEDIFSSSLDANQYIRKNFESVRNFRVGGEFIIPRTQASIRGGHMVEAGIMKTGPFASDRSTTTFGLGYRFNPNFMADISFAESKWDGVGSVEISNEKIETFQFLISLLYSVR